MRSIVVVLAVSLLYVGCGKKKPPETPVDEASDGGFVEIDFSEEDEEDLFGSELMLATAECGDLIKLEPAAMMGKLSEGEIRCLDQKLRDSERQTHKDKLSRVLQADAWAKGDKHRWEGVVRRHLEEIDRSDPDLCYKFSSYLASLDATHADETIRWADVALENRSKWTGDTHVKRVYALYKLKTVSAQKKWEYMEEELAKDQGNAEKAELVKEARNVTKTYAREWLEYARSAKKDEVLAMQLCVSAAGTADFCEQGL